MANVSLKNVGWDHFTRDLSDDQAQAAFKRSVSLVAFAISSYCNRQCTYCPNSIADRKSTQNLMSDDLFFNILRQLSRIDYEGEINITRYNEPLADKEYALSRLRDIRVFLPKARICIFTNGDYMDRAYLDDLARVGVTSIMATVHAGPGGQTDIESLIKEQDRRLKELDLPFAFEGSVAEKFRLATTTHPKGLHLTVAAHDFYRGAEKGNVWAFDRGGALDIPKKFRRTHPCMVQFSELNVEWDGSIMPCCQIQNEVFDHDKYVMGKLDGDSNIFQAWMNASFIAWRIKMFSFEQKDAPCTTCSYGMMMTGVDELAASVKNFRQVLFQATGAKQSA